MQHHLEEFSVTDIRHTMHEGWRIARRRRWYFVFPFCIVSTLALVCSLWVPREYTTRTVVKREHDPVFVSMKGLSWTHPYKEIPGRMLSELRNHKVIEEILDSLDLPENVERFGSGELTPQGAARRRAMAMRISQSLSTKELESSAERDVAEISLTMHQPDHLPEVLRAIRERYLASARTKTIELLRDVLQFFKTESERCREELTRMQSQMVEMELKYPGIDPSQPDMTRAEQGTLVAERIGLERGLSELQSQRKRLEEKIAKASNSQLGEADVEMGAMLEPNPRYRELANEILKLMREIADNKTLRGMTDQHPVVQQMRAKMAMRQEELAATPRERPVVSRLTAGLDISAGMPLEEQLRLQLANTDSMIAERASRLAMIEDHLSKINRGRALAKESRQDYLKLRQRSAQVSEQLNSWEKNIGPIERIFMMEDRDRTIHFATVSDVSSVVRPSSPDARLVTFICLAIGVAIGALSVLLCELIDRSYRTVKQLKTSLGLPVIEGIDQIVTETMRKRQAVRDFVLTPAAGLACVIALAVAGAMAYFSIDSPKRYEAMKSAPQRACHLIIGQG